MKKRKLDLVESSYVQTFITLFKLEHGYVDIDGLPESVIYDQIDQEYMRNKSIDMQIDLVYDWILSQDLCHVTL